MDRGTFHDLIQRVRAGDQAAAGELVARYESAIRRAARFRLVSGPLRRLLDSVDVSQTVLASFFQQATAGRFRLDTPEQLGGLLLAMVRNQVASEARKHGTASRNGREIVFDHCPLEQLRSREPDPGEQLSRHELCQLVLQRLSADERELLDLRSQGRDWATIARDRGSNPVALRKRLSRGLDRVMREIESLGGGEGP